MVEAGFFLIIRFNKIYINDMRKLSLLPFLLLATQSFAGWDFSLTTNAAYYIENKVKTGDEHFSRPSGPYDGAEALTRLDAKYTLPTPLGDHWLLKGATVELITSMELSPITLRPMAEVDFTPLPFLVFGAGASIGSGWNVLGFEGMVKYDFESKDYEKLTPFTHYFYDLWASGTFQFDTGALIEGEWSHVVMVASYKLLYEGLTGTSDGEIWQWQESAGKANGLQYSITGVLGYQMPLVLNMIGVMGEFYGHFDKDDYGEVAESFDGDFTTADLSALFNFGIDDKNSLTTLLTFRRNRSYSATHSDEDEEPLLHAKGGEWSFYRLAFSWKHKF